MILVLFWGGEGDELESVEVDGVSASLAGGSDGVALFVVVGVDTDCRAVADGVGHVLPEVVSDAG